MRERNEYTRRHPALGVSAYLGTDAADDISAALNILLADMFALYVKTKNFHWHVSGPHFRDYHLLFDQQADEILTTIDTIAKRVRKLGCSTLHSIGDVSRLQRLADNDADHTPPQAMLAELHDDNLQLAEHMRETHGRCEEHGDLASASYLEEWIDAAEERIWFLFEANSESANDGPAT